MRPSLPVLTSLRFFAATAVVAFHIVIGRSGDAVPIGGFARQLATGGYSAVTFFFILSGFILTYAHAGSREVDRLGVPATTFWRLRVARILPAYLLGLILALPILVPFIQGHMPLWERIAGPILVVSFLQAWSPWAELWNYPAWTLSVEATFYALFPWLLLWSVRLSRRSLFLLAYVLILAATVVRFIPPFDDPLGGHFPLFHLPLFVFGMALGRQFIFGKPLSPILHTTLFCLGVAALIVIFGLSLPIWAKSNAVLVLVFSLIVFGAARPPIGIGLLAHPALILLGESSYSIYILHVPLRVWWETLRPDLPLWLNLLLYFGVLVGISILSFRCIETPLRRLISRSRLPAISPQKNIDVTPIDAISGKNAALATTR
jgi:peptidoglycan/LPS O-acetylase OafA/YrhL